MSRSSSAKVAEIELPESINLEEFDSFTLLLTGKRGRKLFRIEFKRDKEEGPILKLTELDKNGDLCRINTIYSVDA